MTDSEQLRVLADQYDLVDRRSGNFDFEIQDALRRTADRLEMLDELVRSAGGIYRLRQFVALLENHPDAQVAATEFVNRYFRVAGLLG